MKIGIGLPSAVPGATGEQLLEFARRAEQRGFATLAVFDRLLDDSYEPLVTLAAAAAATSRITLMTYVLLAPLRGGSAQLAKQLASVDKLSGGRLVLGVGLGADADDYLVSGVPTAGRGKRLDAMLAELRAVWAGEPVEGGGRVGPARPEGGPPVLIGGFSPQAFQRAAAHASGWVGGNAGPEGFAQAAARARQAWAQGGREGAPQLKFSQYFALGDGAAERAEQFLRPFYGHFPAPFVDEVVSLALTDEESARKRVAAFEEAGCDEVILFPAVADPEQVDLLADALGLDG